MKNKESFDNLYNKLYDENFNELESLRKKEERIAKQTIIIFVLIFIVCGAFVKIINLAVNNSSSGDETSVILGPIGIFLSIPIFLFIIGILLMRVIKISKNSSVVNQNPAMYKDEYNEETSYKAVFKKRIISPIIKCALDGSEYYYNEGLTKEEYAQGNWEAYDRYSAEDKIITDIVTGKYEEIKSKLILSMVHTEMRDKDPDGPTKYDTVFCGLAGYMTLSKDIGCYIKIKENKNSLFDFAKDSLEMDMTTFEKLFDVETNDRIKTMQLLTTDVMFDLIQLMNSTKIKFEIHLAHDIMHIRFHTGDVFKPNVYVNSMEYEKLEKYFNVINSVKNITEHVGNIISDTDIGV